MADMMMFPDTVEEFMEQYKITDTEQIYTNGTDLVPIFRMKQWFEHAADVAPRCPHYIRNVHDRGDDSLCEKWGCEVKEVAPVRHGLWIKKHDDVQWWKECSECGLRSFTTPPGLTNFRYCPWCGTRMDNGFGGEG